MTPGMPGQPVLAFHDGSPVCVTGEGAPDFTLGQTVRVRFFAHKSLELREVYLRLEPDGEQCFLPMEVRPGEVRVGATVWEVDLTLSMPLTRYRFLLVGAWGHAWYTARGLVAHTPTDTFDFRLLAGASMPAWVRSAVFYQIFPDRFFDGDPQSNPKSGEWEIYGYPIVAKPWGPASSHMPEAMTEFFGGDLPGIQQKLPYLADLGVNALFVNPVFSSWSNHRYDVTDYFTVDSHLGGDESLQDLRRAMDHLGMRLILDTVPNHCGYRHPWFTEAQKDPQAAVAEFFSFRHHPDDYDSWLGHRSLPKLDYRSQALRDTMYRGPEAALRKWLRPPYGIDGWRLDVANMLGRNGAVQINAEVLRELRQAVKEERADAYVLGENFFDASGQLQGDQLDASMNYSGFTHPVLHWINGFGLGQQSRPHWISGAADYGAEAMAASLEEYRASIPWLVATQQFNLLDSHDTPRYRDQIRRALEGREAGAYEREDLASLRGDIALGFQFLYPGLPCIYYGDEVGMEGADVHQARNCMVWEEAAWDHGLRARYAWFVMLRKDCPALSLGGFAMVHAEGSLAVFIRFLDDRVILAAANRGPATSGPLDLDLSALDPGAPWQGRALPALDFPGARLPEALVPRKGSSVYPVPGLEPGLYLWGLR